MTAARTEWLPDRSGLFRLGFGRAYLRDVGPRADAAGSRPPVLFLHEFALCSHSWSEVLPGLGCTRRCIAPDLPGTGNSDRPAPERVDGYSLRWVAGVLEDLLDRLELTEVDVVGHGLGGALAALLPGRRTRRLVLVAPVCFAVEAPFGSGLEIPGLGQVMARGFLGRAQLRRWVARQYSTPELMTKSRFDVYWDRISRDGGREAAHAMAARLADVGDLADAYRRIRKPTLVVWGDRDRILPVEDAERSAALIEGARLTVIDGCGHAPQEERPAELGRLVAEHLDEMGGYC